LPYLEAKRRISSNSRLAIKEFEDRSQEAESRKQEDLGPTHARDDEIYEQYSCQ
jgi:hypothetical protein